MTTKQQKTHWPNNGLVLVITLILFSLGIVSCSKFSREKRSVVQTDSISNDSTSTTENRSVNVDSSLVRTGGAGYEAFEADRGRIVTGGIVLLYNVDSIQNYQGRLRYFTNKSDDGELVDIPLIGEVADDGGLIFKGKLDNVLYSLHIKNTRGNLTDETRDASYDAVFTKGNVSERIYLCFEHCGEEYVD